MSSAGQRRQSTRSKEEYRAAAAKGAATKRRKKEEAEQQRKREEEQRTQAGTEMDEGKEAQRTDGLQVVEAKQAEETEKTMSDRGRSGAKDEAGGLQQQLPPREEKERQEQLGGGGPSLEAEQKADSSMAFPSSLASPAVPPLVSSPPDVACADSSSFLADATPAAADVPPSVAPSTANVTAQLSAVVVERGTLTVHPVDVSAQLTAPRSLDSLPEAALLPGIAPEVVVEPA